MFMNKITESVLIALFSHGSVATVCRWVRRVSKLQWSNFFQHTLRQILLKSVDLCRNYNNVNVVIFGTWCAWFIHSTDLLVLYEVTADDAESLRHRCVAVAETLSTERRYPVVELRDSMRSSCCWLLPTDDDGFEDVPWRLRGFMFFMYCDICRQSITVNQPKLFFDRSLFIL